MMNFTDFRFPQVFVKIGQRLPSPVAGAPLMLMLELARQRSWLIAPENLYDRTFQIHVEDLGLRLCFRCDQGRFKAIQLQTTDVSLSACAMDFLKLATALEDADTLFFRRRLKIEGDTELGIAVKYWIDASERPAWLNLLAAKISTQVVKSVHYRRVRRAQQIAIPIIKTSRHDDCSMKPCPSYCHSREGGNLAS